MPGRIGRIDVQEAGVLLVRDVDEALELLRVESLPALSGVGDGADAPLVQQHILLELGGVRLREENHPLLRALNVALPLLAPHPHAEDQCGQHRREGDHHGNGGAELRRLRFSHDAPHRRHEQQPLRQ